MLVYNYGYVYNHIDTVVAGSSVTQACLTKLRRVKNQSGVTHKLKM